MGICKTLSTVAQASVECMARHFGEWAQRSLVDSQNESREFYDEIGGINQIIENGIVSEEVRNVLMKKLPSRKEWEEYKAQNNIQLGGKK